MEKLNKKALLNQVQSAITEVAKLQRMLNGLYHKEAIDIDPEEELKSILISLDCLQEKIKEIK